MNGNNVGGGSNEIILSLIERIEKLENQKRMIPDYNHIIELDDDIKSYVAPDDGYIITHIYRNNEYITYWTRVTVNNICVDWVGAGNNILNYVSSCCVFPVAKGDVISWNYENETSCHSNDNKFVYCK